MIRKILGAMLPVLIVGVPIFVMAGCSVPGGTVDNCSVIGGTWTAGTAGQVSGAGTVGGGTVSGVGTVGGGTVSGVGTVGGGTGYGVSTQLQNPIKFNTFSAFVSQVTKTAVEILMPFVVLAFIWSGFLFVRAQGNEEGIGEAKKAIWWSIVGAFILMGAWGFAVIISETINTVIAP